MLRIWKECWLSALVSCGECRKFSTIASSVLLVFCFLHYLLECPWDISEIFSLYLPFFFFGLTFIWPISIFSTFHSYKFHVVLFEPFSNVLYKLNWTGAPGWLSLFHLCLGLGSWSQGPETELWLVRCLLSSLFLPLLFLLLSLSQINK